MKQKNNRQHPCANAVQAAAWTPDQVRGDSLAGQKEDLAGRGNDIGVAGNGVACCTARHTDPIRHTGPSRHTGEGRYPAGNAVQAAALTPDQIRGDDLGVWGDDESVSSDDLGVWGCDKGVWGYDKGVSSDDFALRVAPRGCDGSLWGNTAL